MRVMTMIRRTIICLKMIHHLPPIITLIRHHLFTDLSHPNHRLHHILSQVLERVWKFRVLIHFPQWWTIEMTGCHLLHSSSSIRFHHIQHRWWMLQDSGETIHHPHRHLWQDHHTLLYFHQSTNRLHLWISGHPPPPPPPHLPRQAHHTRLRHEEVIIISEIINMHRVTETRSHHLRHLSQHHQAEDLLPSNWSKRSVENERKSSWKMQHHQP